MNSASMSKAISTDMASATSVSTKTKTATPPNGVITFSTNPENLTRAVTMKSSLASQAEAAGSATTTPWTHVSNICIISQGNFSKAHGDWETRANSQ